MSKTKPPYPSQFRERMVELVKAGRTPSELSKEFGCTAKSIHSWVARDSGINTVPKTATASLLSYTEREELIRLRKENKQLKLERDILGKATAWFAVRGEKIFTPSSNS